MMWMILTVALAGECSLPVIESVHSDMTTLTINGRTYVAKGAYARRRLTDEFRACEYHDAAMHLEQWRAMRRATNGIAIGGALLFWPAWIAIAHTGPQAELHRLSLERALLEGK